MNYIDLINQFWRLNEEHSFTSNEVALYFYLLNTSNKLGWKNPFNQSNGYIVNALTMSEPTLIRARNNLKNYGLIDFRSDRGRKNLTIYMLKYLNDLSIPVSNVVSIPVSIPVSIDSENALDNTKHKQKETKQNSALAAPTSVGQVTNPELPSPPPDLAAPPSYPSLDEVIRFFEVTGGTKEMAELFFHKWEGLGWEDQGKPILRWPSYARKFIIIYKQKEQENGRKSGKETPHPPGVAVPSGQRRYEKL